jgi:glyoxylase I family protein
MPTLTKVSKVQNVWPLLAVDNLPSSLAFWRDQLGFEVVGQADADGAMFWCRLERDGTSIMLQTADAEDGPTQERGRGVTLYFVCDEVDGLFAELAGRGVPLQPPSATYYGMRQLFVPEPNGYLVCFESLLREPDA